MPVSRSPKHDPQRQRVYRWEEDLTNWAGARASQKELRQVIRRCCATYRVPVPRMYFVTKNRRNGKRFHSEYNPNLHTITLRPRHMDMGSAIHESAHAITDWILGYWLQPHGKEFLGVYISLLTKLKMLPKSALTAHAKSMRLKFCAHALIGPKHIRRRFKTRVRNAHRERRMLRLWT